MVKTTTENLSPTHVKLEVEVPYDELKPRIDATYKDIANQVQIPGFRKGKVPARLIDQRFGREFVVQNTINENLDNFFQQGLVEAELTPLSRPEVDLDEVPGVDGVAADASLKFTAEMDIRPKIEVPEYEGLEIEVDPVEADEEAQTVLLDNLRARFAELKDVDRPASTDDFVTINLSATIDDEVVDEAEDISYQIGAGNMLEGMDEALDGLSAGEDAVFETELVGGDHAGEKATVKVVVNAVKERELPEANDDFAQLASEFDTIDELKDSLKETAEQNAASEQGVQAQEKVLEKLAELVEVPVPESVIEDQIEQHFSSGNHEAGDDHDTEEHRSEVEKNFRDAFRNEIILDAIADKEEVSVDQSELIQYIVSASQEYGMDPNQFAQMLDQAGQVPMIMGEVRRRKAQAKVLETATVKDTDGNAVDLSEFLGLNDAEEAEDEEN